MTVKYQRSYRKTGTGNVVFVYTVKGSEKELAEYRSAQGENLREDDAKNPLYFTSNYMGESGKILRTSKGNFIPDMSAFDKAASIVKQYGGDFGSALAQAQVASAMGHNTPVSTPQSVPSEDTPVEE